MKTRKANQWFFIFASITSINMTYMLPTINQLNNVDFNNVFNLGLLLVYPLLMMVGILKIMAAYEGILAILQLVGKVGIKDNVEPGEEHVT